MRPDGVEVTQQDGLHLRIGLDCIADDLFADLFGIAIGGFGRLDRVGLPYGRVFGLAVYGAGGGKDQHPALLPEALQNVEQAHQVVPVVQQRFLNRFADGFRRGEVDGSGNGVSVEKLANLSGVFQVDLFEGRTDAGNALDAVDHFGR